MRRFLSNRKRLVILTVLLALLCGCGREAGSGVPDPESMTIGDNGGSGESMADPEGMEDGSAPARERITWGAHDPVYEDGKEVLTFGTMSDWNGLEDLIAAYNQQSEEYVIQTVNYYDEEKGYDASLTALQLDIVRGQAPDILDLGGIDYYPWAEKGILEDLYTYIDKDEELGRDSFMSNVLEAYTIEGKLYAIGTQFNLMTLCGKTSKVGDKTGYNVAELLEMLKRCGEDQNAVWGFGVEEPVLTVLCTFSMNDFIDWDKGTCDFTGEDFKQILEFCKSYQGKVLSGGWHQAVRQDEVLLMMQMFNSVGDYQLAEEIFGEPITCVGFPVVEGSGTLANMLGDYAINAAAANKDACWDFLKYVLQNDEGYGSIPLLRQRFDDMMQQAMTEEMTEDGERVPKTSYISMNVDNSFYVYAASREQVDAFRALVSSADRPYQYHMVIMNIIREEAEDYFNDRKSLEETVAVIQSRVGIYVAE